LENTTTKQCDPLGALTNQGHTLENAIAKECDLLGAFDTFWLV